MEENDVEDGGDVGVDGGIWQSSAGVRGRVACGMWRLYGVYIVWRRVA